MKRFSSVCASIVLVLSACSTPITYHQSIVPSLDPQRFFNGNLYASGVVKDFKGKVIRTFGAELHGSWKNGIGTLKEDFVFNNGERQTRIWTLTHEADSRAAQGVDTYIGSAGDVVGDAPIKVSGNAMFLHYRLKIPYKGSTITVKVDDKMYLSSPDTIINESKLYKFGFKVGSIILTIYKKPAVVSTAQLN